MKLHKQIIFILIVFLKTETLLSENNLFNVNNIQLEKKENITNKTKAEKEKIISSKKKGWFK